MKHNDDFVVDEPEVKTEVKPEVKPAEKQPEIKETVLTMMLSNEDNYIADRMKSQPKTLEEVLLIREKSYAPLEHRLSLPKELEQYTERFAFRWLNKKKRAIDDAINKGWVIANKVLFPNVPVHLFSTSGAIEKGDAILGFMNLKKAEAIRRAPGQKSSEFLKSQLSKGTESLEKGQSGFYKPEDTSAEDEAETGLVEGRDFNV